MYFQILEQVDSSETLAANWPTALTYMSGDIANLETELLISFDLIAHAIQKALNLTGREGRPQLAILEYVPESDAKINVSNSSEDPHPVMVEPFPLFHQNVLREFTEGDEDACKC